MLNAALNRFLSTFIVLLFAIPSQAFADIGIDWIVAQARSDGAYQSNVSVARDEQATSEALRTFAALGLPHQMGQLAAQNYLEAHDLDNTETLARKIVARAEAGQTTGHLLDALLARQSDADGGFAEFAGYESSSLDTAWAIEALAKANKRTLTATSFAVGYLLDQQHTSGSWAGSDAVSAVYVTAVASAALANYRYVYDVDASLNAANAFLLGVAGSTGEVGEVFETALALVALSSTTGNEAQIQALKTRLLAYQQANGSWQDDVYVSAVALRALGAAEVTPPPVVSTEATVTGQITDSENNQPLKGVLIYVVANGGAEFSALTDVEGRYLISGLPTGSATLAVSLDEYRTAMVAGNLLGGQVSVFNTSLQPQPSPTTITVTGRVVDADTGIEVVGAFVRVAGSDYQAPTDTMGYFDLADIPAGGISIEVGKAGYRSTSYSLSAPAGGDFDLGTILLASEFTTSTDTAIAGEVVDDVTGTPLRGVKVTLGGSDQRTVFTDVDGRFEVDGFTPGLVTFTASFNGYHAANGQGELREGGTLRFDAALVREENPAQFSIQGNVVDGQTGEALSGVSISIGSDLSFVSDDEGAFFIGGIEPGQYSLDFYLFGYQEVTYQVSSTGGGLIKLSPVSLAPATEITDNQPPVVTSTAITQAVVGHPYTYQVQAEDPEGSDVTYGLAVYPRGMTIDQITGVIEWTPTTQQLGPQNITVVVSDTEGALTQQFSAINVMEASHPTYAITDEETLNGLTVDALIPSNYAVGSLLSGGRSGTWRAASPNGCGDSYVAEGDDFASMKTAADALDFYSMGPGVGDQADATWDMGSNYSSISVLPLIDHGPFPQEGIEYTVWGSNDPNAPFPSGWKLATLVTIYSDGWFDNSAVCSESINIDDYAGLYTFGEEEFRYLRVKADYSISIFDTPEHETWQATGDDSAEPGWQSGDSEIDGVVGMVCDIKPNANAGDDMFGITGETITFDGSGSQGDIVTYGWDIDGDNEIDLTGMSPSHIFTAGFDGDVALYVVDTKGCVGVDRVRVTVGLNYPRPDLLVESVDPSAVTTNLQSLAVNGTVSLTVSNIGGAPAVSPARVTLFDDLDGDGLFNAAVDTVLGSQTMPTGLERGTDVTFDIPVNGTVGFRDAPIYAFVDSDGRIDESNEQNNVSRSSVCGPVVTQPDVERYYGFMPGANGPLSAGIIGSPRITLLAYEDGTSYVIKKLPEKSIISSGTLSRLEKRFIYPGAVNFVIESNNKLLAVVSQSDFGAYTETGSFFFPASDTEEFYGKEFAVVRVGRNYRGGWSETVVFAKEASVVTIHDAAGNVVATSPVIEAGNYWVTPNLVLDEAYTLSSTGIIAFQLSSLNAATAVPPATEASGDSDRQDDLGTEFFFAVTSWGGGVTVMNPTEQDAEFTLQNIRTGEVMIGTRTLRAGELYYQGGIRTNEHYRLVATTGRVALWAGSLEGGSGPEHLGDDVITSMGAHGMHYVLNTQSDGGVLFAGSDNTSVSLNGESPLILDRDEFLVLDPRQTLSITASRPVTIQTLGGACCNALNDWGGVLRPTIRMTAATIDLTVSQLTIGGATAGSGSALSARIGNSGTTALDQAAEVVFYQGDPSAGGQVLGSVSIDNLAAGGFVDVSIESDQALSGNADIYVVVDPEKLIAECNTTNNVAMAPVLAQTSDGLVNVATDAAVYGAASPVQLQAAVTNVSSLPGEFAVELRVTDDMGVVLERFPSEYLGVMDGGVSVNVSKLWNTDRYLAGKYFLVGKLFGVSGNLVNESHSTFEIRQSTDGEPIMDLRLMTDKPIYHTTDSATLSSLLRSLSSNVLIESAQLTLTIRDSLGSTVFSQSAAVHTLVPGGWQDIDMVHSFVHAMEGSYRVTAVVTSDGGEEMARDEAVFNVVDDRTQSLSGAVSVAHSTLFVGDAQLCTDSVHNRGGQSITEQPLRQLLIRHDTNELIHVDERTVTLAVDERSQFARSIDTDSLPVGAYACALQAWIDGEWATLGGANFALRPPPIRIAGEIKQGIGGRLLVLVDEPEKPAGSCSPLTELTMGIDFDAPVAPDSALIVELYDAQGQLIEEEQTGFWRHKSYYDDGVALDGSNLIVTEFTAQRAQAKLSALATQNSYLGDDYRFVMTVTDGSRTKTWDTGVIHTECHEARIVGETFGGLRVDAVAGADAANDRHWRSRSHDRQGHSPSHDRHGHSRSPSEMEQYYYVKNLLEASGYDYTLTTDAAMFGEAFQTGGYSAYAVLSEQVKLCGDLQTMVREAVYRGEGLLVAGDHDQRNGTLYDALGIQYRGKHAHAANVEFTDSDVMLAQSLALSLGGKPIKSVLDGAQSAGVFVSESGRVLGNAVALHTYGQGHTVHVGYDLLAEATEAGLDSQHAQLLLNAVDHVMPRSPLITQGVVFPLEVKLVNEGIATSGRVVIELPAGVELVNTEGASVDEQNRVLWNFYLSEEQTITKTVWVQVSETGTLLFEAEVQTGTAPDWATHNQLSVHLDVVSRPGLLEALSDSRLLAADDKKYRTISQKLASAEKALRDENKHNDVLADLLFVVDKLVKIGTDDAMALRLKVDEALRATSLLPLHAVVCDQSDSQHCQLPKKRK